ncbi:MAG TPA: cobalamin-binding protein [Alphaproteobacteria bacterium]|nr:cobalamin-binding protein [Alphaproteobacteria bacterium]
MAKPRVVSLIASATEIVAALGARDLLVARSHECDFPEDVASLPAVTAPKLDIAKPSGDIDRQVKALLEQALSVYRVDAERLRALAPDIIVTQTQCEVCAVSQSDVEAALADWTGARPQIVSLAPNGLEDVLTDITRVAAALGMEESGRTLIGQMRVRMEAIARRISTSQARPRVAAVEWIEPLMAAGNWVPELVAMAGGENLFGEAGRHSPWMEWRDLVAADPDIILVLPCGFNIARSLQEMPALSARPEWGRLRAVQADSVFVTDGNQYFNRPGPRLVESLEILAELLHPDAFPARHAGTGWIRLPQTVS